MLIYGSNRSVERGCRPFVVVGGTARGGRLELHEAAGTGVGNGIQAIQTLLPDDAVDHLRGDLCEVGGGVHLGVVRPRVEQ